MTTIREWIGQKTKDWRRKRRGKEFGQGGTARFASRLDIWAARYHEGDILLGAAPKNKNWWVGFRDDRGLLTVATSRSGKGRSAIIPNLILWPDSALVIDPKGTNAAVTARSRGHGGGRVRLCQGQAVFVVDPFHVVTKESAHFNPLAELRPDSRTIVEDIGLVADALVVPGHDKDSHWDEGVRLLLSGLIAHLIGTTSRFLGRRATPDRPARAFEPEAGRTRRPVQRDVEQPELRGPRKNGRCLHTASRAE